jgi:hypothetical protein
VLEDKLRRKNGTWVKLSNVASGDSVAMNDNVLNPTTDTGHEEARAYPMGFCGRQKRSTRSSGEVACLCSADPEIRVVGVGLCHFVDVMWITQFAQWERTSVGDRELCCGKDCL